MLAFALAVRFVLSLALTQAVPPPPAEPVVTILSDIGEGWQRALPKQTLLPDAVRGDVHVGVLGDLGSWLAFTRTLKSEIQFSNVDFSTHVVFFVVLRGYSPIEYVGFTREGKSGELAFTPSANFIAVPGPHLLHVVVPRAGLERVRFRDVSRSQRPLIGTLPL